jgi:hypothetical protein
MKVILKNYFLFIILVLALSTLFFWNEIAHFSLDAKINDSKITNFFVALAAIFTIASVLILYKEYYSKILERQPLIMVESLTFFTHDEGPDRYGNFRIRKFYSGYDKKEELYSPSITLKNIGFGAALELKISWLYDEKQVKNFIQPYYNEFGQPIKHDSILFIAKDSAEKIKIPGYYLTSLGSALHEDSLDYEASNPPKRPNLALIVVYKDIFDKVHQRKFFFDISAFAGTVHIKPISAINS